MDILRPDVFGHFLLQYKGLPLSEAKNVLVTSVGTKIFVLIMEIFCIVSLIRRVFQERFHSAWYPCQPFHTRYLLLVVFQYFTVYVYLQV